MTLKHKIDKQGRKIFRIPYLKYGAGQNFSFQAGPDEKFTIKLHKNQQILIPIGKNEEDVCFVINKNKFIKCNDTLEFGNNAGIKMVMLPSETLDGKKIEKYLLTSAYGCLNIDGENK